MFEFMYKLTKGVKNRYKEFKEYFLIYIQVFIFNIIYMKSQGILYG